MTATTIDAFEGLEAALSNPADDPDTGHLATLEADENESFPLVGWAKLGAVAFLSELVPIVEGGAFSDLERLVTLSRAVARRDLTLAVAVGQCFLGALPIWIIGSAEQRRFVASALANGEGGALAISEREHGADLASTETRVFQDGTSLRLDGTKWALTNTGLGRYLSILARGEGEALGNGLSLFLVDARATYDTSTALPRFRTLGVRGADVGGRSFEDTPLKPDALIGKGGAGLELVQRTLLVARPLASSLALGAADTALRIALGFAETRLLYGAPALALGAPRAILRDAFVSFHAADVLVLAASRLLSISPEQACIASPSTKVFVPEAAIEIVDAAASILGTRAFFREGPHALAQKLVRDVRATAVFDGGAGANRSALAARLPRVVTTRLGVDELMAAALRTRHAVEFGTPILPVEFERLATTSDGGCDPFHAIAAFAGGLVELPGSIRSLAARVHGVAERLRTSYEDLAVSSLAPTHEKAHRHVDVFVDVFVASMLVARATIADADEKVVIEAALRRAIRRLEGASPLSSDLDDPVDSVARLDAAMARCLAEGRSFGPLGARLSETPSTWRVC